MADFPRHIAKPTHIHTMSRLMSGPARVLVGAAAGGVTTAWVANLALYVPFFLPWSYRVSRAFWTNGTTAAGNSDIGIYSLGGARIWSSGSTANTGASALQFVSTGDVLLTPGRYYLAYTNDGTTNRVFAIGTTAVIGRMCGYFHQSSALPLPTAATFAAYSGGGLPLMGITNTASGF